MKLRLTLMCVALLGAAGCGPQESTPPPSTPRETAAPSAPKLVSAEKTSFAEVSAKLDPGGSVYGYLSTAHWFEGLSGKLEPWREMILGLPGLGERERGQFGRVFDVVLSLVQKSGLETISGIGFSGLALEPGYYQSKFVVHHYPGQGEGYLWKWFGTEAHPLELIDWLPTNTVWAVSLDFDLNAFWRVVREEVQRAGIPEASAGLDQFAQQVEQATGTKLDDLLASLGGQFVLVLTFDPDKKISFPMPDGTSLQIPEPGLALALKVRDDRWFEWADRLLGQNPQTINGDNQDLGLRMRTLPVPLPFPLELRVSVARSGDYLWVASHDQVLRRLAEVKAGRAASVRTTAEFKKLMEGLPAHGNQFVYISENLQAVIKAFQETAVAAARSGGGGGPPVGLLEKLFAMGGKVAEASVGVVGPEGWLTVSHGHQQPADMVLLPAMVAPTAIVAGMTLPALARAKTKAQSIACVNNLKQLGLAARIYAVDHTDQYPPDFLSMKDEMGSPRILICPEDPKAPNRQDVTWESLRPEDISYEYLGAGKKEAELDPQATLFRCRFHGHTCRMDGSVMQNR